MKLLQELSESVETKLEISGKDVQIFGIFMQAEIGNGNGRVYPIDILEREVNRYQKEFIESGRAVGELKHPETTVPTVDLDRISHRITFLERDGNNYLGRATLLDTPTGNIAKGLIKGGVKLGVSSRGLGTVTKKNNLNFVNEDFRLITPADIVFNPSAPDAMVDAIVEEADWLFVGGKWVPEFVEKKQEIIHNTNVKSFVEQDQARKIFEEFFKELSKSL